MSHRGWTHDAEGQDLSWRPVIRLWPFVRPHAPVFAAGIGVMAVSSGVKLLGPYLLKIAIDGPMATGDFAGLALLAGLYFAAQLLEAGLDAGQAILVRVKGEDVLASLRAALFAKTQRLRTAYLDTTPGGRILSRITSDVAVLSDLFSSGVAALLGDVLLLAGILVVLVRLDGRLALITFAALPVLVAISELFRRKMRAVYRETREKTARLTGRIQEFLRGFEVLRAYGAEPWADQEFGKANADHRDSFLRSVSLYALFFPLVELVSSLTLGLLIWQGGRGVLAGGITLGVLVAFIEYLQKFFRPVRDLSEKYNVLQASAAAAERIAEFLDLPEEAPGTQAAGALQGRIEFRDVAFAYDGGPPVIRGVSLALAPGEVVALVGPTGAGKSTLVHLLLGLYRPTEGSVLLDGLDVTELDPRTFRSQLAVVPQDVFLFHGTVLDNIRLGRTGIDRRSAIAAAEAVGLHEMVSRLPQGYDTPILEGGTLLSAGQRQLVSFARALAGDPRILVLDEATSEVDQSTEAKIEEALQVLFRGRTSVVVAHRLATVRRADRVVVLTKGRIAEQGRHEDLLRREGLYRTLYELQFRRGIDAIPSTGKRSAPHREGALPTAREARSGPEPSAP